MPTSTPAREEKLSLATKFFFGAGDIYGGGAFVVIGFFTRSSNRSGRPEPGPGRLVFTIGKAWDAVSDPLMGYLSDRTRSRFGRRRVYFLAGILPLSSPSLLLWTVPPFVSQWAPFLLCF